MKQAQDDAMTHTFWERVGFYAKATADAITKTLDNPIVQVALTVLSFLPVGAVIRGIGLAAKLGRLFKGAAGLVRGLSSKVGRMLGGLGNAIGGAWKKFTGWNRAMGRGGFVFIGPRAKYTLSKHAVSQMLDRGISSKVVDRAMKFGKRYHDTKYKNMAIVLRDVFPGRRSSALRIGYDPQTNTIRTVFRDHFNPNNPRWRHLFWWEF